MYTLLNFDLKQVLLELDLIYINLFLTCRLDHISTKYTNVLDFDQMQILIRFILNVHFNYLLWFNNTVKPVLNGHSQKDRQLVFKAYFRLMQIKSIAECCKWSILQYI